MSVDKIPYLRSDLPPHERLTPMQAIYDAVVCHGYARNKHDFAKLLRMSEGNVYAYLDSPQPRGGHVEDRKTEPPQNANRIGARMETVHAWAWAIGKVTKLKITVIALPDGRVEIEIGGRDSEGEAIAQARYETSYDQWDFRATARWKEEWDKEWGMVPESLVSG